MRTQRLVTRDSGVNMVDGEIKLDNGGVEMSAGLASRQQKEMKKKTRLFLGGLLQELNGADPSDTELPARVIAQQLARAHLPGGRAHLDVVTAEEWRSAVEGGMTVERFRQWLSAYLSALGTDTPPPSLKPELSEEDFRRLDEVRRANVAAGESRRDERLASRSPLAPSAMPSRMCSRCGRKPARVDDLCKKCAYQLGMLVHGKIGTA